MWLRVMVARGALPAGLMQLKVSIPACVPAPCLPAVCLISLGAGGSNGTATSHPSSKRMSQWGG